jgi:hypothetical protein
MPAPVGFIPSFAKRGARMAKKFPVVQDDAYEEMAASYQLVEMARLNEVLQKHKVPVKTRRKICEMYFFGAGVFLDSGWLKSEGKQVFPTLCFARRPVDPEEGLGGITKLYTPTELFAFHEYVAGDIVACFDEGAVEEIEHGNL